LTSERDKHLSTRHSKHCGRASASIRGCSLLDDERHRNADATELSLNFGDASARSTHTPLLLYPNLLNSGAKFTRSISNILSGAPFGPSAHLAAGSAR